MGQARYSPDPRSHDDAKRWHAALAKGSFSEKVEARTRLAVIYEHRGMLAESIEMLETNLRLGAADDWHYRQLLGLYRQRDATPSLAGSSADQTAHGSDDGGESELLPFPVRSAILPSRGSPASASNASSSLRWSPLREARGSAVVTPDDTLSIDGSPAGAPRSSGGSLRSVITASVGAALGATLVFGISQGDWRPLFVVLMAAVLLLASRWFSRIISARDLARVGSVRLPAIGGLAVLGLLATVVWLDARVGAPSDVPAVSSAQPQARPVQDIEPSQDAAQPATSAVVASAPSASQALGTTTIDGLLLGTTPQATGQSVAAAAPPSSSVRRSDLVVVDASGGVWLRTAPGDGSQIKLLANGAELVDLGESREAGGQRWRRVREPRIGDGWIADAYVRDSGSMRRAELARRLQESRFSERPISAETAGYLAAIQPRLQSADQALQGVTSVTTRAVERPGLIVEARWKADLVARVATLQDRARELQAVALAPPELSELARAVASAGRDLTVASDDLLAGIEALDSIRISAAADRLDGVDQRLDRASSQLFAAFGGR
jgi:hypothetical protein